MGNDDMTGELNQMSLAIGELNGTVREQNKKNEEKFDVLFDKMDAMHKDVQNIHRIHDRRLGELEACKAVVEKEDRPAIQGIAREVHDINTKLTEEEANIWKRRAKAIAVLFGLTAGGGTAGAGVTKWFGL